MFCRQAVVLCTAPFIYKVMYHRPVAVFCIARGTLCITSAACGETGCWSLLTSRWTGYHWLVVVHLEPPNFVVVLQFALVVVTTAFAVRQLSAVQSGELSCHVKSAQGCSEEVLGLL